MKSLRYHVLATAAALIAACAMTTAPAAFAATANEAAHDHGGAMNNHGHQFDHRGFKPARLGH